MRIDHLADRRAWILNILYFFEFSFLLFIFDLLINFNCDVILHIDEVANIYGLYFKLFMCFLMKF